MKNFSGGIRDEIVLAVPGCIPIPVGRMQDQTGQKWQVNIPQHNIC